MLSEKVGPDGRAISSPQTLLSEGNRASPRVPSRFSGGLYFPSFPGDLSSPALLVIGASKTQQKEPFLSSSRHSSLLSLFKKIFLR